MNQAATERYTELTGTANDIARKIVDVNERCTFCTGLFNFDYRFPNALQGILLANTRYVRYLSNYVPELIGKIGLFDMLNASSKNNGFGESNSALIFRQSQIGFLTTIFRLNFHQEKLLLITGALTHFQLISRECNVFDYWICSFYYTRT